MAGFNTKAQPTSPKQVKPNSNPGSPTRPVIARPVKANAKPPSSSLTVSPVSAGSKPTVVKSSPVAKRGRSKPPDLKFAPIDSTASALTGRGAAALNGRRSPLVSVGNRNRNALSKSPSPARKLPLDHSGASNASMDLPAEHKREREKAERAATAAAKREDLHALKQAREDDKLQAAVAAKAQVEAYEAQSKQQAQTQADWKRSERETKQLQAASRAEAAKAKRAMQDLAERQTDILENNKLKAKLSAHMAAAQDAAQREDRASVSAARVDMVRHTKSKLREEEAANERAILVANKYKSDAARFAAEGAKAEAKRMAHELALSHIEGLQQIKQSAVKDAALQKDFLVSEKEKADLASAVLRAEQAQTKAMRHEYAVARAESLHVIKQNAVATAAKEREALASAQRQAIQAMEIQADLEAANLAQKHELSLARADGYKYKKWQEAKEAEMESSRLAMLREEAEGVKVSQAKSAARDKQLQHEFAVSQAEGYKYRKAEQAVVAAQERELLALERTRAESHSQSRADADDTAKQLQREMQAARLEGLRSVKEAQKRADQEAKDLLVLERERAVKASLTRAERAAADKALRHEMAMVEAAGLRSWSTSRVAVEDSLQGTSLRRSSFDVGEETLNALLQREGLSLYANSLQAKGVATPQDLAAFDAESINDFCPKVIHKRKLKDLITTLKRRGASSSFSKHAAGTVPAVASRRGGGRRI